MSKYSLELITESFIYFTFSQCMFCYSDFNECGLNLHNCDANAFCTDIIGGFTCTCNQGYTGNGVTCTSISSNINECSLNTDNCDVNAACADTEGSFTCTCNPGYEGDGVTCQSNHVWNSPLYCIHRCVHNYIAVCYVLLYILFRYQ